MALVHVWGEMTNSALSFICFELLSGQKTTGPLNEIDGSLKVYCAISLLVHY